MNEGRNNTILLTVIGIATLLVAIVGATFAFFTARLTGDSNSTAVIDIQSAATGTLTFNGGGQITVQNVYPRGAVGDGNTATDVMTADGDGYVWLTKSFYVTYTNNSANDYVYNLQLNYTTSFGTDQLHYVFKRVAGYCSDNNYADETKCETAGGTWTSTTIDSSRQVAEQANYFNASADTGNPSPINLGNGSFAGRVGNANPETVTHAYALTISYPDSGANQNYAGDPSNTVDSTHTNHNASLSAYFTISEVHA